MLICDKRRPRTRGDTNIRPPQGGRIKTAPPASGPRLRRSSAWGGTPPDPLGCAPWCAFAHRAPAASVTQPEGFRARVRPVAGVGNRLRLSMPDAQPLAVFGLRGNLKKLGSAKRCGGIWGACPPCRAAVGNPAQAVGGQGAAACCCARRPWTGRGCPRATGFRARTTYRVRSSGPQTRAKPRCERKKKDGERNI